MNKYFKTIFFSSLILVLGYHSVSAATIFVSENQKSGLVIIDVMLDTQDENINALSGNLFFDSSILGNPSIHTEDSIVNNWIITPTLDQLHSTNMQKVSWSGIIPGGFEGVRSPFYEKTRPGKIFQIVFTPLIKKETTIYLKDLDLKANDGLGSTIPVKNTEFSFGIDYISANIDSIKPLNSTNLHALVGRDKNIFDNKYFIAFEDAEDSSSIDHYEMLETYMSSPSLLINPDWQKVTSPAVLNDQERDSYIHLRAVGRDGSIAYIIIKPEKDSSGEKIIFLYVIITIILLSSLILFRRKSIRNKTNNQ